jgi:hypothetical protein
MAEMDALAWLAGFGRNVVFMMAFSGCMKGAVLEPNGGGVGYLEGCIICLLDAWSCRRQKS